MILFNSTHFQTIQLIKIDFIIFSKKNLRTVFGSHIFSHIFPYFPQGLMAFMAFSPGLPVVSPRWLAAAQPLGNRRGDQGPGGRAAEDLLGRLGWPRPGDQLRKPPGVLGGLGLGGTRLGVGGTRGWGLGDVGGWGLGNPWGDRLR